MLLLVLIKACKIDSQPYRKGNSDTKTGKKVEIRKIGQGYQLFYMGEPYEVKGAGGYTHFEKIKENGGNSVRVWHTENADSVLDAAHGLGLTVMLGLEVGRPREGFDYDDREAVLKQREDIKAKVLKYKDHPALLFWSLGNEVYYLHEELKNTWVEMGKLIDLVKELDPDHPVTTTLAGSTPNPTLMSYIKLYCPNLDFISYNKFGHLEKIPYDNRHLLSGWEGPYLLSECGPAGYWNIDATDWDAPVEWPSTYKAQYFKEIFEEMAKTEKERLLGSYVFYWGTRQERTHTLFSIFLEDGKSTEMVNVMHYLWKGEWPDNRAPAIEEMLIGDKTAWENQYLNCSKPYEASVKAIDPDGDPLMYKWEIRKEGQYRNITGGDLEQSAPVIDSLITDPTGPGITFTSPSSEGAYRLFVYVYDGHGHVATANIPFYSIPTM